MILSVPATYYKPVWVPPTDRFVEYREEDERWCRYFGMGTIDMHLISEGVPRCSGRAMGHDGCLDICAMKRKPALT